MSYEVANVNESLGQFASNKGYSDLITAAKTPALRLFFQHGATEDVPAVVAELRALEHSADPDVGKTAKTFADLIRGQDLVVIHNGTE
jgi:hypothetical protein